MSNPWDDLEPSATPDRSGTGPEAPGANVRGPGGFTVFLRGATKRCPRCGSGRLFTSWFKIRDRCPRCGLRLEREEGGFLGAMVVLGLFVVLLWRGLRIGLRTPEPFGAYLALGITVLLATQTFVNLGAVTGLLPTKGLPLPFISFGGSALVVTMFATGVLLNISQHADV